MLILRNIIIWQTFVLANGAIWLAAHEAGFPRNFYCPTRLRRGPTFNNQKYLKVVQKHQTKKSKPKIRKRDNEELLNEV